MLRLAFLAFSAALASFALATPFPARAQAPLPVVATFSILGDLVQNVGGARVSVVTLVGPNGDSHAYTPRPTDAKRLAAAKLIVINGLGFERWLDRLIDNPAGNPRVVIASRGIASIPPGTAAASPDPHAWQAVANVAVYVANIRDALIAADPESRDIYAANAAAYQKQLDALDRDIRAGIARIPQSSRRVVTAHPSFRYFAAAYGLEFSSPQNLGAEAEASAKNVAAVVDAIRRDRISAMFVESAGDPRLMRQIAAETGVRLGGALYADALTDESGPAPTYIAMMRHNLGEIERALRD